MATKPADNKPQTCKHCKKPGFKGADGKMQHERRGDPAVYGGRRKDPKPPAGDEGGQNGKTKEREPDRVHPLFRPLFGKKDE